LPWCASRKRRNSSASAKNSHRNSSGIEDVGSDEQIRVRASQIEEEDRVIRRIALRGAEAEPAVKGKRREGGRSTGAVKGLGSSSATLNKASCQSA